MHSNKSSEYDTYVISENGKEVIEHHSWLKLISPNEQSDSMFVQSI